MRQRKLKSVCGGDWVPQHPMCAVGTRGDVRTIMVYNVPDAMNLGQVVRWANEQIIMPGVTKVEYTDTETDTQPAESAALAGE